MQEQRLEPGLSDFRAQFRSSEKTHLQLFGVTISFKNGMKSMPQPTSPRKCLFLTSPAFYLPFYDLLGLAGAHVWINAKSLWSRSETPSRELGIRCFCCVHGLNQLQPHQMLCLLPCLSFINSFWQLRFARLRIWNGFQWNLGEWSFLQCWDLTCFSLSPWGLGE